MPPKKRPERSDQSGNNPSTPTVPAGLAEELEEMIPLMTRSELVRIVDVAVQGALAAQQRRDEQSQPISALDQYQAMRLAKPQPVQASGSKSKRKWTGSSSSSSTFQKKKFDNPSNRPPSAPSQTQSRRHRRELVRQNPSQSLSPTAKIQCFNCRQYGHYQMDCPQPIRPRSGRPLIISPTLPTSEAIHQTTEPQGNQPFIPTLGSQIQAHVPSASNVNEHSDLVAGNATAPSIP